MTSSIPDRWKLLIVDDDPRWRNLVRDLFESQALVAECTDGADAILGFRSLHPDWVIMDIAMEPIDGLTAARQIKAEFPEARIIFLTQFSDKEFREEAERLGAAGYVLKDDMEKIEEIIQRAHGGSRPKPEPRVVRSHRRQSWEARFSFSKRIETMNASLAG